MNINKLALYIGRRCNVRDHSDFPYKEQTITPELLAVYANQNHEPEVEIKPILRPLEAMTDEEMKEVCRYTRDAERTLEFYTAAGSEEIQPDVFCYLLSKGFDLGLFNENEFILETK